MTGKTGEIIDYLSKNNSDLSVRGENGESLRAKAVKIVGAQDILWQDNTERGVIVKFNQVQAVTTLAAAVAGGSNIYSLTLTDASSFVVGHYLLMYQENTPNYFFAYMTAVDTGTGVVELDSPIDLSFAAGSIAVDSITNMNVLGSKASPQVFGLRSGNLENPTLDVSFDITRIMFTCTASSSCDYSTFANIAKLTNGLVLRRRNGAYNNIFNVKTNGDLAGIMFDFEIIYASNPAQGQDGFRGRLTFAGPEKLGVAIRIAPGEDLELLVQDDLSGITVIEAYAEGHEVID